MSGDQKEDISNKLISAVRGGHLETAKSLINSYGLSYSKAWSDGYVLLRDAVTRRHTKIAELLLKRGSKVNIKGSKFNRTNTPLHFAALYGNVNIVKVLLNKGADINAKNKDGKTPLFNVIQNFNYGCKYDKLEVIKLLLKHTADVNAKDISGTSPLHIAIAGEWSTIIVKLLLEYGADVNARDISGASPLHIAINRKCSKIVELLLEYGADVNFTFTVTRVVQMGTRPGANTLRKEKKKSIVQPCIFEGYTPLHCAVECGWKEVTTLLLSRGAKVDVKTENGITPLHIAAKRGYIHIVEDLVEHGACINSLTLIQGCTPLHFACEGYMGPLPISETSNFEETVKFLLNKGADINASTIVNLTLLHMAIKREIGDEELIIKLLNEGVDVNAKQKDGITLLHIAIKECRSDIIKILIKYGAKVNSKSQNDITPLHLGATTGNEKVVETLLKFGADINSTDVHGRTPLHIASNCKHAKVVEMLLEYGSDINVVCRNNQTPLDYAKAWKTLEFHRSFETTAALKCQIIKMKTANIYVSERNLLLIHSNHQISDLQAKCEEEIEKMKSEKIDNAVISFYDILARDTSSLAKYMRNENVVQILKSDNYKSKFPIYASMIKCYFRKVMKRKELLDQVNEIIYFLFNNLPELPDDCNDKILSYLNDEALRIIIDACNKSLSDSALITTI